MEQQQFSRPPIVPALPQIRTFTKEVTNDLLRTIKLPPQSEDSSIVFSDKPGAEAIVVAVPPKRRPQLMLRRKLVTKK